MTQQQLAERLGVSFASVNRWENGQTRPAALAWQKLLEVASGATAGVSPDSLGSLGGEGELPWLDWPETQTFERKGCFNHAASPAERLQPGEVARQIAETLVAMANADGGIVLVGQEDLRGAWSGSVTGVPYADRSLALLREAPKRLVSPPLDACSVTEHSAVGVRVLMFETPSSVLPHRLTDGRYLQRAATQNLPCSEETIRQLKTSQSPFERRLARDAGLSDLSVEALGWFAAKIGWRGSHASMLEHYDLSIGGVLNMACLLLFAARPRRWHDHPGLTIVRYPGTERGVGPGYVAEPPERVEAPLVRAVEAAHASLGKRLHRRVVLRDLFFEEELEYPEFAWQEAVINAVAHRDYSLTGAGIEIWLFDDRLEVRSPGVPPSPVTIPELLKLKSLHYSRNPLIVRVFTDCGLMREQGEGIPRMFSEMEDAALHAPDLSVESYRFCLTLRNTPVYDRETAAWLRGFRERGLSREQLRVLALARSRGGSFTSREVQRRLHMDVYRASVLIKSLVRLGVARLRERRGRVYDLLAPADLTFTPPDELLSILDRFLARNVLSPTELRDAWQVSVRTTHRRVVSLVEGGWLERVGGGRRSAYRLSDKSANLVSQPASLR